MRLRFNDDDNIRGMNGHSYGIMSGHKYCEVEGSSFKAMRIRDATENKQNEGLRDAVEVDSDEQDTIKLQTTTEDTLETQDLPSLHTDPILDDTPATPDEEVYEEDIPEIQMLDVEWR